MELGLSQREGKTYTVLWVTIDKHLLSSLAANQRRDFAKLARLALLFNLERVEGNLVLEQAAGVAPPSQQQSGVVLIALDNGLFDVLVHRGLDGSHEPCAHVDTRCTKQQGSGQAVAIGKTTTSNEGDLEGLTGSTQQNEVGDVALANVAGTLEAVNGQEVDAELNGALGMANGSALVEDNDAGLLQLLDDRAGRVACRLDNLDTLVNDGLGVGTVVRRDHGREESDVDGEGLLGKGAAPADFVAEGCGRREDEGRNNA